MLLATGKCFEDDLDRQYRIDNSLTKEILFTPRLWAEGGFNIVRWTMMPRGGHFAALEEPELLVDDVRAFFRDLR